MPLTNGGRDVADDYLKAYISEYESYLSDGLHERANEVAVVLHKLGHEVDKAPTGGKQRAVSEPKREMAVDADAPSPKRRTKGE